MWEILLVLRLALPQQVMSLECSRPSSLGSSWEQPWAWWQGERLVHGREQVEALVFRHRSGELPKTCCGSQPGAEKNSLDLSPLGKVPLLQQS